MKFYLHKKKTLLELVLDPNISHELVEEQLCVNTKPNQLDNCEDPIVKYVAFSLLHLRSQLDNEFNCLTSIDGSCNEFVYEDEDLMSSPKPKWWRRLE